MSKDTSRHDKHEENHVTPGERLIVALDFNNLSEALELVDSLEGSVSFFKVGFELFLSAGLDAIKALHERGHKVFFDLKMDDVVETITRAMRQMAALNVEFVTIHGSEATARAAVDGRGENALPKIFQITVLTSLNGQDFHKLGVVGEGRPFATIERYIEARAESALQMGCDGLITSGENVGALRQHFVDKNPILICPGIRPEGLGTDDHKRPCTPFQAIKDGADYIVVGRPIRNSANRPDAAKRIIEDIGRGISARVY